MRGSGRSRFSKKSRRKTSDNGRRVEKHRDSAQASPRQIKKARLTTDDQLQAWQKDGQRLKSIPTATEFSLDDWQERAVGHLVNGANVVVDAPTTAGKTKVVETFFADHLHEEGFRACYTCPVKSLSNDKLKEFRQLFGSEAVGISTGDIKENLDAPIVVATLESYRNSLIGIEPDLGRKLVVFDEYHYIQDEGRGSAWEEAIILTPPSCQVLLLSASIENSADFAKWLERVSSRPAVVVQVTERPVPLAHMVWHAGDWYLAETFPSHLLRAPARRVGRADIVDRIVDLERHGLVPCLVYAGKRLDTVELAHSIAAKLQPLSSEHSDDIRDRLELSDQRWRSLSFLSPDIQDMIVQQGVAFHHSGIAPAGRLAIEDLIKGGLVRYCVATMGLSLGINFSVRSAVISDFKRPSESGMVRYSQSEVLQMIGRAGRRGRDPVGFSCWLTSEHFRRFSRSGRTECSSRLKAEPTAFLSLLTKGMSLSQIESFYKRSFLKFKNPSVGMDLATPPRIRKQVGASELPCESPMHMFSAYSRDHTSLCVDCVYKKSCHRLVKRISRGYLARLHQHLHQIGALGSEGGPTEYGAIARFFPHSGGLLFAYMVYRQELGEMNALEAAELIASLSLAKFKTPRIPSEYRYPFPVGRVLNELRRLYPVDLFPECYDLARSRSDFREFNPLAGWIVREWLEGKDWQKLIEQVTSEFFGLGDVTGLIYRVASFLQSVVQIKQPGISEAARDLRRDLLREPVTILL